MHFETAIYRNPRGDRLPGLSRGGCPQSYPQNLWIDEKGLMKPPVSAFLHVLHEVWGADMAVDCKRFCKIVALCDAVGLRQFH